MGTKSHLGTKRCWRNYHRSIMVGHGIRLWLGGGFVLGREDLDVAIDAIRAFIFRAGTAVKAFALKAGTAIAAWWSRVHAWLLGHTDLTTLLKLGICVNLGIVAGIMVSDARYGLVCVVESVVIMLACCTLQGRFPRAGSIASAVLTLLYMVQVFVLIFANSYVTLVMVTNLNSVEDLGGKALVYGAAILVVILVCLLPVRPIRLRWMGMSGMLSVALCAELVLTMAWGGSYSPLYAYVDLAGAAVEGRRFARGVANGSGAAEDFYQTEITDWRSKDPNLPGRPNVVVIFTEGLSQNVVDDERGIMPNVARYEQSSLSFHNYYNHTFATYRGLQSQLYSGYQMNDYDTNSLVSIQSIMGDQGYHTSFVNAEPNNGTFSEYLRDLGFDEVVTDTQNGFEGYADSLSDRQTYDLLFDTMEEQHASGEPFFTCAYAFGTHASFDGVDNEFGDGSDAELNKFYDADCQFGTFMERFNQSDMADDTIIVFTADHCSYADMYFTAAFPDHPRVSTECDAMPLFIYYRGIAPEVVECNGRNSVDLAPTILDYLDISAPNYFLGISLFADPMHPCDYDTMFYEYASNLMLSTRNATITDPDPSEAERVRGELQEYFAAKQQPLPGSTN